LHLISGSSLIGVAGGVASADSSSLVLMELSSRIFLGSELSSSSSNIIRGSSLELSSRNGLFMELPRD
jgi:hypothetical protein